MVILQNHNLQSTDWFWSDIQCLHVHVTIFDISLSLAVTIYFIFWLPTKKRWFRIVWPAQYKQKFSLKNVLAYFQYFQINWPWYYFLNCYYYALDTTKWFAYNFQLYCLFWRSRTIPSAVNLRGYSLDMEVFIIRITNWLLLVKFVIRNNPQVHGS